MTIDEAIKLLEDRAFWKRDAAEMAEDDDGIGNEVALAEAAEDEQLAEWLRELKEAKRLLKAALADMNNGGCTSNCYKCKHCGVCDYSDRFTWELTDEAEKLIGGSENG